MTKGHTNRRPKNAIITGDCVEILKRAAANSVDFILTDPPYLCNFTDRSGRKVLNDDGQNVDWLFDSSREMYRVLKDNSYCVSFYGYFQADKFYDAWKQAGFRVVGHFAWVKPWTSGAGFTQRKHENAVLLAKGNPAKPQDAPADVMTAAYTGNRLHPTQKPIELLQTFIRAYAPKNGLVLDPFAGSGSTSIAAKSLGRRFFAIELDPIHANTARSRMRKYMKR